MSLGALLCQRFSEMLPPPLFFEPDTIFMSDGRDGGDGSGTLTGPMTNSVIIVGYGCARGDRRRVHIIIVAARF